MALRHNRHFRLLLWALSSLCFGDSFVVAADKITYDDHVLPVLRDKCLGCHNADKARGGLDASNYAKLMEGGSSGAVVKPGSPDGSRLYTLSAHKEEPKMPPNAAKSSDAQLETLRKWIEQGAPENSGSKVAMKAKPAADVALKSVTKGRPAGPPPMPTAALPTVAGRTPRAHAVTALATSPWAPLVAVAGAKQVLLYHADTLDLIGTLPFPHGQVNVLKFSRNGGLLLAGGGRAGKVGKVTIWNVATGKVVTEVGNEADAVLAADISADQTQVALGGPGKTVRIYATADGSVIREIKKHTDWVTAIEFSPDGVLLATGDRNGGLFVWEAHTGREFFSLRGHQQSITDLSWRDDANVLASCSEDSTARLWEMENGTQFKSWQASAGGCESVRFGHDGRLVTCGRDRAVKVWDGNGNPQKSLDPLPDLALRSAFSHDSARVLAGDLSGALRVWSVADWKPLGELSTNPPTLAERLNLAVQDVTARQTAADARAAAVKTAEAALQQADQELKAGEKSAADATAVRIKANVAVVEAKQAIARADKELAKAQSDVSAREVKAKAFAEAAAKVKDAATKAAGNVELAAAAEQSRLVAEQSAGELAAAQKSVAAAAEKAKALAAKLPTVEKAAEQAAAAEKAAGPAVNAKRQAKQAAENTLATARKAADQAAAEVTAVRAIADRLKASVVKP